MDEYNKYVAAINKIFENIAQTKTNWPDQDNLNYIESIEEYRNIVRDSAEKFKPKTAQQQQPAQQPTKLEE